MVVEIGASDGDTLPVPTARVPVEGCECRAAFYAGHGRPCSNVQRDRHGPDKSGAVVGLEGPGALEILLQGHHQRALRNACRARTRLAIGNVAAHLLHPGYSKLPHRPPQRDVVVAEVGVECGASGWDQREQLRPSEVAICRSANPGRINFANVRPSGLHVAQGRLCTP